MICDNMVSFLMKKQRIHAVVVGADRVTSNGDTANKIGTYQVAESLTPSETFGSRIKGVGSVQVSSCERERWIRVNITSGPRFRQLLTFQIVQLELMQLETPFCI